MWEIIELLWEFHTWAEYLVHLSCRVPQIGCVSVDMPQGGLYPCVGLAGPQDVVRLGGPFPPPSPGPVILSPHSPPTPAFGEDAFMAVDYNEDDWRRLHDVKLNGQVIITCTSLMCAFNRSCKQFS